MKTLDSYAEYDHDASEIRVRQDIAADPKRLSYYLRHEMVHAALGIAGLTWLEKFEEEAVVRCLDGIFHPAWDAVRAKLP